MHLFWITHNGKGKQHLLTDDGVLCGSKGDFNYTDMYMKLKFEDGKVFEQHTTPAVSIHSGSTYDVDMTGNVLLSGYCSKCMKVAMKNK